MMINAWTRMYLLNVRSLSCVKLVEASVVVGLGEYSLLQA
jgi:hypothetical protein